MSGPSRTRTCNLGFGDRCFTIETIGPIPPLYTKHLLLDLFVGSVLAAPTTMLGELDLALDQFLVFTAPIVNPVAGLAGQFD